MTPKVLLVEDNPDDEALFRRAFERVHNGETLDIARDGQEAIARTLGRPPVERPVLILLDLKLPGLSGLEVLERLRADEATMLVPIVVISASAEPSDMAACYERGANSYLVKPGDFTTLQAMVRELVKYWLRLNEPPPVPLD